MSIRKTMADILADTRRAVGLPNKQVGSQQIVSRKINSTLSKKEKAKYANQQVDLVDGYYHWTTGTKVYLGSVYFHTGEFECPKGVNQKISKKLVDGLIEIRAEFNAPITITSGYRTALYNEDLKSRGYDVAKNSQHLLGNAADITARQLPKLLKIVEQHFDAMGIGTTFLHVDTRDDKLRRWTY